LVERVLNHASPNRGNMAICVGTQGDIRHQAC
jgi:hypothetical protein